MCISDSIRSAAGAFGMLAVLAMALMPFVRLGAFYLALRLAGAIGADAVSKAHAGLISNLASAMGYMLAIAASTLWMSLVSVSYTHLGLVLHARHPAVCVISVRH